jgi:diguanylate cyclase (GGDEF)-like protein
VVAVEVFRLFVEIALFFSVFFLTVMVIRLRDLAYKDQLTELYNTRYLFKKAGAVIRVAKKTDGLLCGILIDFDKLKNVNDIYSHEAGDKALLQLTRELKKFFRNGELIVRRNQGDEFIILFPAHSEAVGRNILSNLNERLNRMILEYAGKMIRISASAGFSCVNPYERKALEKLLKQADIMMYKRKEKN